MMLINKFSALALFLSVLFAPQILAMKRAAEFPVGDSESAKKKKKKVRECLEPQDNAKIEPLGSGHKGLVFPASPIKNASPHKKRPFTSSEQGVRKQLKTGFLGNYFEEASKQSAIRELLRSNFEDKMSHIAKVDYDEHTHDFKMAKAEGITLENGIGSFKPLVFLSLVKEIMEFIKIIHEETGYSHEDLSPSNIMVLPNDPKFFVILDWELSGKINVDKRTITGVKDFSAPELADYKTVGPEADVYSFGKILEAYSKYCQPSEELVELIKRMTRPAYRRISLGQAIKKLDTVISDADLEKTMAGPAPTIPQKQPEINVDYQIEGYIVEKDGSDKSYSESDEEICCTLNLSSQIASF